MPETSIKGQFDILDAAVADLDSDVVDAKAVIDTLALEATVADLDGDVVAAKAVIDAIYATMALPKIVRKEYTFDTGTTGATGQHTLFTVTGAVKAKLYAICTTELTPAVAGATISIGIAAAVTAFIAVTTAADIDTGDIWFAAAPATTFDTDANAGGVKNVIGDGSDITADILTQAIASGVVEFMCEWEPITSDGNVVAA